MAGLLDRYKLDRDSRHGGGIVFIFRDQKEIAFPFCNGISQRAANLGGGVMIGLALFRRLGNRNGDIQHDIVIGKARRLAAALLVYHRHQAKARHGLQGAGQIVGLAP